VSKRDLSKLADAVFADAINLPPQKLREDGKKGVREGTQRFTNARIIDLNRITPDPNQVRKIEESSQDIAELSLSIRKHGVLQPITVRYDEKKDCFIIITGERRYWASKKAGEESIPCIIKEHIGQEEISFQQMVENLQRENLNPVEEAEGIKRLGEEFKITSKEISEQLGKSESYISRTIRLNDLPQEIKKEIATSQFLKKNISKEHLIQVVRQNDPEKQVRLWQVIKDGQANIREVRELAKKQKAEQGQKKKEEVKDEQGQEQIEEKQIEEKKELTVQEEVKIFEQKLKNMNFNGIPTSEALEIADIINKLTRTLISAANKLVMNQ
jgi:ParB family chromosome partitioning protein